MKKILIILSLLINSLFAFEHLTNNTFDEKVKKGNVVINFYATWCSICSQTDKNLKEYYKNKNIDVTIYKVDISEEVQLTNKFDAQAVPLLVYFKEGKVISRENGIKTHKQIEDRMNKYFN